MAFMMWRAACVVVANCAATPWSTIAATPRTAPYRTVPQYRGKQEVGRCYRTVMVFRRDFCVHVALCQATTQNRRNSAKQQRLQSSWDRSMAIATLRLAICLLINLFSDGRCPSSFGPRRQTKTVICLRNICGACHISAVHQLRVYCKYEHHIGNAVENWRES